MNKQPTSIIGGQAKFFINSPSQLPLPQKPSATPSRPQDQKRAVTHAPPFIAKTDSQATSSLTPTTPMFVSGNAMHQSRSSNQLNIQASSNKSIKPTRLRSNSLSVISSTKSLSKQQLEQAIFLAPQGNVAPISVSVPSTDPFAVSKNHHTVQAFHARATNNQPSKPQNISDFFQGSSFHDASKISDTTSLATMQHPPMILPYTLLPHNLLPQKSVSKKQPMIISRKMSVPDNRTLEKTKQNITMVTQSKKNRNGAKIDTVHGGRMYNESNYAPHDKLISNLYNNNNPLINNNIRNYIPQHPSFSHNHKRPQHNAGIV